MSTAIHCDNLACRNYRRDDTPRHIDEPAWIHATYLDDHSEAFHFCSWSCLADYALSKESR